MHYLLDPQILSALLTAILFGIGWSIRMLYRIARDSGDTHRKVETMWQWWLLHVSKVELPKGDDGTKTAGFSP